MLWLDLLILAFATARITSLLVNEEGPLHVFERLRVWCGVMHQYPEMNRIVLEKHPRAWLGEILNCVWCCGMWVAIGVWAIYVASPITAMVLFTPFALAYAALLALRKLDG